MLVTTIRMYVWYELCKIMRCIQFKLERIYNKINNEKCFENSERIHSVKRKRNK